MDPLSARLEPLLSARFANTRPVSVPRYQRYPLGDGKSANLIDFVQNNPQLFQESTASPHHTVDNNGFIKRRQSDGSFIHGSNNSIGSDPLAAQMASRKYFMFIHLRFIAIRLLFIIFMISFTEMVG